VEHLHIQPGEEFTTLQDEFGNWNGWLCSFAIDANGATVGESGNSSSLSSPLDLELLKSLRSQADCIVTTGQTARIENYKASRYAPIAFLSRSPKSLTEIPAFLEPGDFQNIVFSDFDDSVLFLQAQAALEKQGFKKLLFEGGRSSLISLITQGKSISILTSISNSAAPSSINPEQALLGLIGDGYQATITKDLVTDTNRIIQWSVSTMSGAQ
jgi:riboflavin biosynthesis pyrimidine reductase